MSGQDWLKLELQNDGVTLVTMQNAPVNAFNPKSLGELEALFAKLASDGDTKAVVLASDLKVFSAGLNLKEAQHYDLAAQQGIVDGFHKTGWHSNSDTNFCQTKCGMWSGDAVI